MDNPGEILRLCRLCLVKDQVNIPIFEEQGDIRQIFLKISSCLPVKVSRDDQLPKKICDGCLNKLDLLYEFWNTSVNAEKTLLSWLGQAGVKDADEKISAVAQQIAKSAETQVKQEALEDGHAPEVQSFEEEAKDESEAPPPKRARRTAAVKAQINITPESDDDDDMDSAEAMTKVEDETDESDGEDKDPSYGEVPGTSADDQAGPSGVGKDGVEAPTFIKLEDIKKELNDNDSNIQEGDFVTIEDIRSEIITAYPYHTLGVKNQSKGSKIYSCIYCKKTFSTILERKNHMDNSHRKNGYFECTSCPKMALTLSDLNAHMRIHDLNRQLYKCEVCLNNFTTKCSWAYHMKKHNQQYDAECKHCHKKFITITERNKHITEKHNGFLCPICGIISYSYKTHRYHIKQHDPNFQEKSSMKCEFCHKIFTDMVYLRRHVRNNHENHEKPEFVCGICFKVYNNRSSLDYHMDVHSGAKAFECDVCHQKFTKPSSLKVHQRLHTGEKPYKCNFCDLNFARIEAARTHEKRTHINELEVKQEESTLQQRNRKKPQTPAEKHKRRRDKLLETGRYEEFKIKHREAARRSRAKMKKQLETLPQDMRKIKEEEQKKKDRERVKKWRLSKKDTVPN